MEKSFPSKTKIFSQFINHLVDFSLDNSNHIENLISNSDLSDFIIDFSSLFSQITEESSKEHRREFSLKFSELLTFLIFSYYIRYRSSCFSDLISEIYSSKDNIVLSVLEKYSLDKFQKFLITLAFERFFLFLKTNYNFNFNLQDKDKFKLIYETFLIKYNKKQHKKTGSYFSPLEAINFILPSVELILSRQEFINLLQTNNFIFLDPACGTGSFLIESNEMITSLINRYNLSEDTIKSTGFDTNIVLCMLAEQNFHLLLKNNLDASKKYILPDFLNMNLLADINEFKESIKKTKGKSEELENFRNNHNTTNSIPIIFGNPPYSAVSNNSNNWINSLLKGKNIDSGTITHNYFEINGKSINEKKSGWLYDDYIKFIRLGHYFIDQSEAGILSFVSNNAFLSNPSFRGMRSQLLKTFDECYILDLHGNKLVDNPPQGIVDENIFNIIQGNCIFIFIKNPCLKNKKLKLYYFDIWGSKKNKLSFLKENNYESVPWIPINPQEPFYTFLPENNELKNTYLKFWSLKDIFKEYGTGLITSKDSLTLQFSKQAMINVLSDFVNLNPEKARVKYALGPDTENWKVTSAQQDVINSGVSENLISKIVYRPFDTRYTYYTGKANGFHGRPKTISNHLFQKDNLALISARTNKTRNIDHFFISSTLTEAKCAESSTQSYIFPLKVYKRETELDNFNNEFIQALEKKLNCKYSFNRKRTNGITNEDIISYIYAITYSTNYRNDFKTFFMYDFPRIPLIDDYLVFKRLIDYGRKLITLHLLDFNLDAEHILEFCSAKDNVITKVLHKNQKLFINKEDFFYPVSESAYNFTIGNYKVLTKWLIGRKNTCLSIKQINEFMKIVYAINETILLVEKINELY